MTAPSAKDYIEKTFKLLLNHIVLCEHGTPVSAASIIVRPNRSGHRADHVNYDDPFVFRRTSPVLYHISFLLTSLLQYVEIVDTSGQVRAVDGFQLRDPERWKGVSHGDPTEVLNYVSGTCGISCAFCYLRGNPSEIQRVHKRISERELLYRLDLYERGQTLFQKNIVSTDEQTTNPHLMQVLRVVRRRTDLPIAVETNGVHLTEKMIAEFHKIGSLFVNVSVNSVSPDIRRELLCDRDPSRIKRHITWLADARIPFSVSIVPWHKIPLDDVETTVRFAHDVEANHIRIRLPGYTSAFSQTRLYDLDTWWQSVIRRIQTIREDIDTPIIVEPSKYEQLVLYERWRLPVVLGVVRNSPAYRAGIRHGDYVSAVNGRPPFWRSDGLEELTRLFFNKQDVSLEIQRGKTADTCRFPGETEDSFPYSASDHRAPYGLYLCDDIHTKRIRLLKAVLEQRKPASPVLVTSTLMKRSVTMLLDLFGLKETFPDLDLVVIPNTYLGGNIFMGDLMVVKDVLDYADKNWKGTKAPDLLVIPSSGFNEFGRDLVGESYKTIEFETGIPVVLLPARIISQ